MVTSFVASTCVIAHNIFDFGAIESDTSYETEKTNAKALFDAIIAANSTENDDNTITLPAGKTFSSLNFNVTNLTNVNFVIDGTLLASKHYYYWKTYSRNSST